MPEKLTILFAPVDFVGHVNACIGIAEVLRDRGHRIVFAISDKWKQKLNIYGFEEEIIELSENKIVGDTVKIWSEMCVKSGLLGSKPPIEKIKNYGKNIAKEMADQYKKSDPFMKEISNRIKPDLIVIDSLYCMPSLMYSGVPWVWSISCNPLYTERAFDDERIPPSGSGLPSTGYQNERNAFREAVKEATRDNWNSFNNWIMSKGYPSLPENKFTIPSPYLNIYMFPEELDYTDLRQLPKNWCRFDCFKRSGNEQSFQIPEKLMNKSGKLIYLSMGTIGCADIELMKRFVSILSKSKHRFIVSKGPLHEEYELADNMWGEKTVPQIKVLALVDLVITHGGNNTFTESLYFGKPMIVMPLFNDQFDNAQRIQEKGFGIRLDPYQYTETQLLESIEILLNDEKLASKLNKMSKRIQSSKSITKVTELFEDLVKH